MKKVCPKCKGKGCSHCGGTGYHESMNEGGMMNKGMKALKKAAPEVAKRMGYKHGGLACGASNPAARPVNKGNK